ncbi:MAG: hypothetical protein CMO80_03275, partial [Verrucomicrobiales bacterium]|nr:hypothetical protein [Verrucomicrobiales bacterium]
EKAAAAEQELILSDFRRIRQFAGEILDRVNASLEVGSLREDPSSPTELKEYILQTSPKVRFTIKLLLTQPVVKESDIYPEDLGRIETAIMNLAQHAEDLLGELSGIVADAIVAEFKDFEETRRNSEEDISNTTFLTNRRVTN